MAARWHPHHLTKVALARKVKAAKKQKKGAMKAKTIRQRRSKTGKDVHYGVLVKWHLVILRNEDESSSESETESSSEEASSEEDKKTEKVDTKDKPPRKTNLDLLLDLDEIPVMPVMTPSLGGFLTPLNNTCNSLASPIQSVAPHFISVKGSELLSRINGSGLTITYRFTRNPHLFSTSMANIGLVFTNTNEDSITDIRLGRKV